VGDGMKRGTHNILVGDCIERLGHLPAGHFHACMTSPPYFALRSYLPAGHPSKDLEIGSEPTPDEFVETMVTVFREVRRVLRDDGYMFVNLGDSYDAGTSSPRKASKTAQHGYWESDDIDKRVTAGLPPGSQLLMPHRVALALQADGWVLRDTVIWSKRSPMPSSQNGVRWERCRVKVQKQGGGNGKYREGAIRTSEVNSRPSLPHPSNGIVFDAAKYEPCPGCKKCSANGGYVLRRGQGRTTTAHEYLFLFTKGNDYFWDMENCREACSANTHSKGTNKHHKNGKVGRERTNASFQDAIANPVTSRIPRSVWTLSSEPTKYKHFATYPSELVRRCLLPLSPRGCCPVCGAQWAPVVESERVATRPGLANKIWKHDDGDHVGQRSDSSPNLDPQRHIVNTKVIGYRPTCTCTTSDAAPCRVLDPFSGTGTTGQTACFLGHDYTGIELNPEYAAFADEWIAKEPRWSLRSKKPAAKRRVKKSPVGQRELFH
jgi:DNA modification methylase